MRCALSRHANGLDVQRLLGSNGFPAWHRGLLLVGSAVMNSADRAEVLVPSNRELLAGCLEGDRASWTTLVRRYERLIFAVVRKEGFSDEEAKDIVQHVFAELVQYLDSIAEPERLGSWLMTVARHQVWRERRALAKAPQTQHSAAFVEDDFAERYAVIEEVHAAVLALGDPCRSLIFDLFFNPESPDYATIAVGIGRPVGSIGPMRSRCLERLRSLIEDARHV